MDLVPEGTRHEEPPRPRRHPAILRAVQRLHARGRLRSLEVTDWFTLEGAYLSPEGLHWGRQAHAKVGKHLAAYLRRNEAGNEAPADR